MRALLVLLSAVFILGRLFGEFHLNNAVFIRQAVFWSSR